VLVRRIQEQIRRCPELSEYSTASVSSEVLQPIPDGENTTNFDLDAMTEKVTRAVSRAMNKGEKTNE
jgi:hypothetical protein